VVKGLWKSVIQFNTTEIHIIETTSDAAFKWGRQEAEISYRKLDPVSEKRRRSLMEKFVYDSNTKTRSMGVVFNPAVVLRFLGRKFEST